MEVGGEMSEKRYHYDLDDDNSLNVTCTSEGVIMDVYLEGDLVATVGMMADEWVDWILKVDAEPEWAAMHPQTILEILDVDNEK